MDIEVGFSYKPEHHSDIIKVQPQISFFEIHAENYLNFSNNNFKKLEEILTNYPISVHAIGLSLGSNEGLDLDQLKKTRKLLDKINPIFVSDHLSFAKFNEDSFYDLLPVPYSKESMAVFVKNINLMQDVFKRQILIENPSRYLDYNCHEMSETEFINEICAKTGCGLILDINNVYVSGKNIGFDASKYLSEINHDFVKEIHLAGHELNEELNIIIDTHSRNIKDEVFELTKNYLKDKKTTPHILIEWDNDLPEFSEFLKEKEKLEKVLC